MSPKDHSATALMYRTPFASQRRNTPGSASSHGGLHEGLSDGTHTRSRPRPCSNVARHRQCSTQASQPVNASRKLMSCVDEPNRPDKSSCGLNWSLTHRGCATLEVTSSHGFRTMPQSKSRRVTRRKNPYCSPRQIFLL